MAQGHAPLRLFFIGPPPARCRGAACRSRRCTGDSCRVSIQWQEPIVSVAALTAQPLAALPPYGCGVPFTGVERLWQLHISARLRRPCNAPGLSLRGGRRPTWRPERAARGSALGVQSREGSHDFADSLPVIRLGTARLPRRFAPRNDTSGEREVHQCPPAVELLPTGRSLPVKGTPHP